MRTKEDVVNRWENRLKTIEIAKKGEKNG